MAPLVENEDFYKDLDPILDIINKKIVRMDESMKKKYVKIMLEVVNIAIEGMKEIDEVFDKLYSTTQFVGSYFDGLRVAKPTEFDINLIMNMPCDQEKLQFEIDQMTPGLAKINIGKALKRDQLPEKVLRTVDNWCDKEGYILIDKVNAWLESVLTRFFGQAAKTLSLPSKQTVKVKFRKAGPAFTLNIEVGSDFIDVDLVFTILYSETMEPPSPIPIKWTDELSANWVLVPKPSNDSSLWRVSFPDSEKKLLHNMNKLKLINRFLKALRDAQNFQFPSYFIKTLFLSEAYECLTQNRNGFWEKRQGYLFIYMLYVLYSTLNNKLLPYIWQKECNLYDRLNPDHLTNVANRISHIISKINDLIVKKDNDGLKSYISDLFTNEELGFANLNLS